MKEKKKTKKKEKKIDWLTDWTLFLNGEEEEERSFEIAHHVKIKDQIKSKK